MKGLGAPLRPAEIRRGLETKRLGTRIHYFPDIDSTNVFARKRAQEGGLEGEIVIAESQSHGKGRLGRSWVSPPNLNLHLSVILRPRLPPLHGAQITLMSAVALAETVQAWAPFEPEIKWPNDILVEGKKLAGILSEASCEAGRILFVVLGIGVNLNFPRALMPEGIRERATSLLHVTGKPVDRDAFTVQLIQNLDRCYGELEEQGFPFIASRWEGFFRLKGRRVKVEMADQTVFGRAAGIDAEGALILEDEGGEQKRVLAGDVIPMES